LRQFQGLVGTDTGSDTRAVGKLGGVLVKIGVSQHGSFRANLDVAKGSTEPLDRNDPIGGLTVLTRIGLPGKPSHHGRIMADPSNCRTSARYLRAIANARDAGMFTEPFMDDSSGRTVTAF